MAMSARHDRDEQQQREKHGPEVSEPPLPHGSHRRRE
jgi:hypothetical protein